jgi:tripartite-type tricarboxylate transporter receptor subunit TctC
MKFRYVTTVTAIFFLICSLGNSVLAQSQQYPIRPIRLIVPYAPGGTTDIVARIIAEPLGSLLGQVVIVDNKAGAGGAVGTAELARSAGDGYTIGVATVSTMIVIPASVPKLNYSQSDFATIINVAATPNIIAVNPKFPVASSEAFIAKLKEKPGQYSYATSGKGSINHMLGESFQSIAKVDMVHIPYRGSGPAINDVVAGQVPILVDQLVSSKAFIDSGRLRLIGVVSPKRLPGFPNVPTFEELGVKGFSDQAWYGLIAPSQTPPSVLLKIEAAMQNVLARPDIRARIEASGATILATPATSFTLQLKNELYTMQRLIFARKINFED